MKQVQISKGLTRKVWQQLEKSLVPIVSKDQLLKLDVEIDDLNFKIRSNSYMPGTGHGYFGVEKRLGVTSRKVVWLFPKQLRLEFVPVFHGLQGRLAAQG